MEIIQYIDSTGNYEVLQVDYIATKGYELEITASVNLQGVEVGALMSDDELEEFNAKVVKQLDIIRTALGTLEMDYD